MYHHCDSRRRGFSHGPAFASAALLPLLFLASCGPIWRSPDYYFCDDGIELPVPVLTMEEYSERAASHARPYIVRVESESGAVVLFGAEHTKDPENPQLKTIRRTWDSLKPTVALVEGRLGFLFRWFSDPVTRYGESGFVYDLAKDDGISTYTWEPRFEAEIAEMLKAYPQKRVALFYVLRPYLGQVRHAKPDDPDDFVEGTRGRRTAIRGLEGSLRDIAEIDSMWRADFAGMSDWRDTSDIYGWPGYLNDIAKDANAFRDKHFIRVLIELARKGERVFAVCGSSHAVKLEPALKAALGRSR